MSLRPGGMPATQLLTMLCAEEVGRPPRTVIMAATRALLAKQYVTEVGPESCEVTLTDAGRAEGQRLLDTPAGQSTRRVQQRKLLEFELVQAGGSQLMHAEDLIPATRVSDSDEAEVTFLNDLLILLRHGRFEPDVGRRVKTVAGERGRAHRNAARMFADLSGDPDVTARVALVTGYALDLRGHWHRHSWLVRPADGRLLETTTCFTAYFGVELASGEDGAGEQGNAWNFVTLHAH